MQHYLRFFVGSSLVTIIGLVLGVIYQPIHYLNVIYLIVLLAVLEVSLSFDNAVVNAKVLTKMSPFWQKMFLWLGIFVAVFVVRLLVPVLLVSVSAQLSFLNTLRLALHNTAEFQHVLASNYALISAFGGGFLLMIFLNFLFTDEERVLWFSWLEQKCANKRSGTLPLIIAVIFGVIFFSVYVWIYKASIAVLIALVLGILLSHCLAVINTKVNQLSSLVKAGIIGFLYLEVLDASFSFDGLFAALVMSNDIVIILLGLAIGAMFVRSLTLFMVKRNTLNNLPFLEHGAHYSIGYLALTMWLKNFIAIPEYITGTVSVLLIVMAFIHSKSYLKEENKMVMV
ncbi:DUF475 domain-containing protein [Cysteiniphilum sp. QT6929]|uniref:DUF475 domain-containing protein n=1 Tax=Cysteiniphilum sp. QT6929 TaxID=2975055 RepID=UPI0024B3838D|nr:DUF475 domain-containing protein [Cysteiniphilum sp. QT6929]WHN65084.1 DUF475 domain-containing protein [Cysteiniphilum sp. QT6929]